MIFYRDAYHVLWIDLTSDEPLGVLDTSYVENYDGTDGAVTLYHVASGRRYSILVNEVPRSDEPGPHRQFTGWADLAALADGAYRIEGRVRDLAGNYAILSEVAEPRGDERQIDMTFVLRSGAGAAVRYEGLVLEGHYRLTVPAPEGRKGMMKVTPADRRLMVPSRTAAPSPLMPKQRSERIEGPRI